MPQTQNILEIKNLSIQYETEEGIIKAVNNLELCLGRKRVVGIVGETGAGKTTTALAALNLIPSPPGVITSGEIFLDGIDVLKKNTQELEAMRGKDISMIFQDPMTSLNPVFTVGAQIAESIILHENVDAKEAEVRARAMLEKVGIPGNRADDYPHEFSGGMRQRVVIAIALACHTKLLIADEPTTALDVTIQAQVLELMKDLKNQHHTSMILITHNLGIVAEICDEVAVMYAGSIVERGLLNEVFAHPSHPYTVGLFNSLPNINRRKNRLQPIPGLMPDPIDLPKGCAFAPRCLYAKPQCFAQVPTRINFSDTHEVSCIAYEDPDFAIKGRD